MTPSATSELGGGSQDPPFSSPIIRGWTIEKDLVWHGGSWCTAWNIYIELPSGEIAEVRVYDVFPAQ